MRLVIFDIDGTLTQTTKVDEECFVRALAEVFDLSNIDTDWSNYKHATDAGVFHEVYEASFGRTPSSADTSAFREHFLSLLAAASVKASFVSVAGAPPLLSRLANSKEYRVALATGAWSASARLKLSSAGLCYDDYPAASSDDSIDRQSIIRLSIHRASERYGPTDAVVYVGDGIWDLRASRSIGIPFVGIAQGERAGCLMAEGAVCVMPDFTSGDLFLTNLFLDRV